MDIQSLFEAQKVLDQRIICEKGLAGKDLAFGKILALFVELGELANAWRGFKFWSLDRNPQPTLLEEYVDCLHFILSILGDIGFSPSVNYEDRENWLRWRMKKDDLYTKEEGITKCFLEVFELLGDYSYTRDDDRFEWFFVKFVDLGILLGFSWDDVEKAYFAKNRINHERQANGY